MANKMEPMPPIPANNSKIPIPQLSTILSLATPGTNHLLATLPEISLLEEIYIIGRDLLKEYFGLGSLIAILPIPD